MEYLNNTIEESWEYWCYYRRVIRNKASGEETLVQEGRYLPSVTNVLRIGSMVSEMNASEDLVEYTALAIRPAILRLHVGLIPLDASLLFSFSALIFNGSNSSAKFTLKPWANASGEDWISSTEITYGDIVEHYIPFNLAEETYDPDTYEKEIEIAVSAGGLFFSEIQNTLYTFLTDNAYGMFIVGEDGYADVYSPQYTYEDLRPQLGVTQVVPFTGYNYTTMATEITGKSHVIGVCRDLDGEAITGVSCLVAVFDLSDRSLLGSGSSDPIDGSFRIKTECKSYTTVILTFVNESLGINGSELMETFGSSSSSSMSSSSSSS